MLDEEDIRPRRAARLERHALEGWSVAELAEYIAELRAEITRAEAAIAAKEGARGHADRFFKT